MTFRSILLLYCLHKFNGERTIYGMYHLLNGKKSSQTIGDANLFGLAHLFGVLRPIQREQIEEDINNLIENKLIEEITPTKYILTPRGKAALDRNLEQKPVPKYLNGWKYNDQALTLWRRLSLLSQSLSNLIQDSKQYTPIQQDDTVVNWVKGFLMKDGHNRFELAESIYHELLTCLELVSEIEATIFVLRLTSSSRIGYTIEQISDLLKEDETWCHVMFIHTLHRIVQHLESSAPDFPILVSMIEKNRQEDILLTASTKSTYKLLLQGKSIEEVALLRDLKRNTIEDHIVEVAHHNPEFSIDPFVPPEHQEIILSTYNALGTKQLRSLKEKLPSTITYFGIRLVLAKIGGNYES
ncbi:helix-turn-helix domain-containing protein [Ferdinandcohnia sp. Marseille-Q9671]